MATEENESLIKVRMTLIHTAVVPHSNKVLQGLLVSLSLSLYPDKCDFLAEGQAKVIRTVILACKFHFM